MTSLQADVLVIGGGATGAGVVWDAALRGFDAILVDRADLAEGTSGRFHGLLHSGGRYVVKDPVAAEECVVENAILRRVIPDCIEDTGGLFVDHARRRPGVRRQFLEGVVAPSLPTEEISVGEALKLRAAAQPRDPARVHRARRVDRRVEDRVGAGARRHRARRTDPHLPQGHRPAHRRRRRHGRARAQRAAPAPSSTSRRASRSTPPAPGRRRSCRWRGSRASA